jgi:hypothetical protein
LIGAGTEKAKILVAKLMIREGWRILVAAGDSSFNESDNKGSGVRGRESMLDVNEKKQRINTRWHIYFNGDRFANYSL